MKKYLIVIAGLALIACMSQFVYVVYANFSDVDTSTANYDQALAIDWLKENGVVQGYSDGTFRPNNLVNRAEFLKMLYETIGMDGHDDTVLSFTDVPASGWYIKYVKEAFATHVVDGYPDGTFRPEKSINYAEAIKIVMNGFFDVDDLHLNNVYRLCVADLSYMSELPNAWYWKYVHVADNYCIIPEYLLTGIAGFDPADFVTRGSMAELLYRAKAVFDNFDDEEYPRYSDDVVPNAILETDSLESVEKNLILESDAFESGENIPIKYSCDGSNVNPDLEIAGVSDAAKSLALVLDDPDAPGGTFTHWIMWNIDPDTTQISENSVPVGAVVGKNSFGEKEYGGPCPPASQTHRYYFKLYALDKELSLSSNSDVEDLQSAMSGHQLASASIFGTYSSGE